MEKIVFGLQNITFRENCDEILAENRNISCVAPIQNFTANWSCISQKINNKSMSTTTIATTTTATLVDIVDASINKTEKSDGEDVSGEEDTVNNATRYSLRKSRSLKENDLHKVQRRTIARPAKKTKNFTLCTNPSDIKKIYMTKSLSNFRPTNLETIFEEPQSQKVVKPSISAADSDDNSNIVNLIGGRKLRRSLSCSDGTAANKTLIKQRRAKIKRLFGRRFALKKIALDDFMQHLKTNIGTDSADEEHSTVMPSSTISMMEECDASDSA